ncbi:MAG: hypothetical protein FJ027_22545 [Candidatus Rokubacteria bacterium]|nr:hypothetical protein [Candidatus Rokubacteria bacterium]
MTASGVFLVTRTRGPRWDDAQPLEGQADWSGHATFMNALAREGFVVLGGPIADTRDVMLVIRARDAAEIERRLAEDPWTGMDLLRITSIRAWTLRLGSLPVKGTP